MTQRKMSSFVSYCYKSLRMTYSTSQVVDGGGGGGGGVTD